METDKHIFPPLSPKRIGQWWNRVRLFLVYCLIIGISLELGARIVLWPRRVVEKIAGLDDSTRRILWVKQHQHGDKLPYPYEQYDSVRGWAMIPNLRNLKIGDGTILSTNSQGIRGSDEFHVDNPGRTRIAVLGDSFTFGNEVSDQETYSYYLHTLLSNTDVLNFGVTGYGHDQMLLYLQSEVVKYRPNLVLLGFVWLDMHRNLQSFLFYAKPRFVFRGKALTLTNVPVPPPEDILRTEFHHSKFLDLAASIWHRFDLKWGTEQESAREITSAIFDEFVATCRQIGATPVFVYLPITDELLDTRPEMSPNEHFLSWYCQSSQVSCAFLRPAFMAERGRGISLETRRHYRAFENLVAARALAQFLEQNNLVPSQPRTHQFAMNDKRAVSAALTH